MSPAHARVVLPILPEAGVATGVATWIETLVRTADAGAVRPLGLNVDRVCHLSAAMQLPWSVSHRVDAVVAALANLSADLPAATEIYVAPGWGEIAYLAAARFAARRPHTRILAVCHTDDESYLRLFDHFQPAIGALVGVSGATTDALCRRFPHHPVVHAPHPLPDEAARVARPPATRLRLLYAGRLVERQKRVSRLVGLATQLRAMAVEFTLTVAGEGPERGPLERAFADAGLGPDRVRFAGLVERTRMAALYAGHDVLVLTSDYEGSPLALLEAMASGMVPVAMAASGVDEVVREGMTGHLVAPGAIGPMAERLAGLAASPVRLAAMGGRAAESIRARHRPEHCWEALQRAMDAARLRHASSAPPDPWAGPAESILRQVKAERVRALAVYGAGMFGRYMADALLARDVAVRGFLDRDPAKTGWLYRGIPVTTPDRLAALAIDTVVVGTLSAAGEVHAALRAQAPGLRVVAADTA